MSAWVSVVCSETTCSDSCTKFESTWDSELQMMDQHILNRAARGVMRRGGSVIDRVRWPSRYSVPVLGQTYKVTAHGRMSHRQYFVSREDDVIAWLLQQKWSTLGYVGASYGLQPMVLSRHGRVLAFEPVACIFSALVDNVRRIGAHNVTPIPVGVGAEPSTVEITHSRHHGGTPALGSTVGTTTEPIVLISLADPLLSVCDALFMDIEGHESDVLLKGPDLPSAVKLFVLELHRSFIEGKKQAEIFSRLEAQGFTYKVLSTRPGQDHVAFTRP